MYFLAQDSEFANVTKLLTAAAFDVGEMFGSFGPVGR